MENFKQFNENNTYVIKDRETIENKIIEQLNYADNSLDENDFNILAESIIDYIDEIGRSKRN
tara:strand:- start:32643 stop:32828 length:186 start_codon:yes stop_codon:yes gene_type:complete